MLSFRVRLTNVLLLYYVLVLTKLAKFFVFHSEHTPGRMHSSCYSAGTILAPPGPGKFPPSYMPRINTAVAWFKQTKSLSLPGTRTERRSRPECIRRSSASPGSTQHRRRRSVRVGGGRWSCRRWTAGRSRSPAVGQDVERTAAAVEGRVMSAKRRAQDAEIGGPCDDNAPPVDDIWRSTYVKVRVLIQGRLHHIKDRATAVHHGKSRGKVFRHFPNLGR